MLDYIIFSVEDDEGIIHVGAQHVGGTTAVVRAHNKWFLADFYHLQTVTCKSQLEASYWVEAHRAHLGLPRANKVRSLPQVTPNRYRLDIDDLPTESPHPPTRRRAYFESTHEPTSPNGWWNHTTNKLEHV